MRGMCHNVNMKGLINDVWSCIECLLREAYQIARPGARIDLALGFIGNSGRHRSVCISEMTQKCCTEWASVSIWSTCARTTGGTYATGTHHVRHAGRQEEAWWGHFDLPDITELPGQSFLPSRTTVQGADHPHQKSLRGRPPQEQAETKSEVGRLPGSHTASFWRSSLNLSSGSSRTLYI